MKIKEYIDQLFEIHRHYLDLRWQTATHNAEMTMAALDKRLETMNEIRQQLNQQAATFATREYVEVTMDRTDERIRTLQAYRANMEGRTWAIGAGFAIVNLMIAAASYFRV